VSTECILKRQKSSIRAFLRQMGDEELAILLAHAQSGRLAFNSCCCLIGLATIKDADHAPLGRTTFPVTNPDGRVVQETQLSGHYWLARDLEGALAAETAFRDLVPDPKSAALAEENDTLRRRILIPLVRGEIRRRDAEKPRLAEEASYEKAC
jgi:hypothetical protein